nr:hypothetical protein GCM10017547_38760 [Pseudarthrobacter oxydans]
MKQSTGPRSQRPKTPSQQKPGQSPALTGDLFFTLPVTSVDYLQPNMVNLGMSTLFDASASAIYQGYVTASTTTTANIRALNAATTYLIHTTLSSTIPMTWATGDIIGLSLTYEAA